MSNSDTRRRKVLRFEIHVNLLPGFKMKGKQWSVTQRTAKNVTVTLDTDEERMKCTLYTNRQLEGKLSVLMLPRFQGSQFVAKI